MLLLIYLLSPHLFLSCAFFPSNITFQSSFHTLSVKQGIVYQPVSAHLKECGEEEERDRKKNHMCSNTFHLLQLQRRGHVSQFPYSRMPRQHTSSWRRRRRTVKRAGMRKTEAGRDIPLWLRMILHSACSMSELLLKTTLWAQGERNCTRNNEEQSRWVWTFCSNILLIWSLNLPLHGVNIWCKNCLWHSSLL